MAHGEDPDALAPSEAWRAPRGPEHWEALKRLEEGNLDNLQGADLRRTNLRGADLRRANLEGANLEGANLRGANLRGANLRRADLRGADLEGANLQVANLQGADLQVAHLLEVNLLEANLKRANLRMSTLKGANLQWTNLAGATLEGANLERANLERANFQGAYLTNLVLSDGIARAITQPPVTLGWRTVARSLRWDGLHPFLVRTGMPGTLAVYMIESLRTLDEMDLFTMLQSVFLSYGTPDEDFAVRLREALASNGVKTWFYPRDAVPGRRHHRHLQAQIHAYDRMILCCSRASLRREGVMHEVEEALEREHDEGASEVLIPILLEPIFDTGKTAPSWWPSRKEHVYVALRRRVCANFRDATSDADNWDEQLGRVLRALRKRPQEQR